MYMKKDGLTNSPNNKVVIICKVLEYDKDIYSIIPQEVALGKIDDKSNDFICMDNERSFPELKELICDGADTEKLYYFAPMNINDLVKKFRIKAKEAGAYNKAMIMYLKNIREHLIEARIDEEELDIRFIEKSTLNNTPTEPNLSAISKPTIIIPKKEIVVPKAEDVAPSKYINPLGVKIDLAAFIKYMQEQIMNNDDIIEDICTTIAYNLTAADPRDVRNIFAIGPTGCGKTETLKAIQDWAKPYKIPVVIYDSNSLSTAGYEGKSIDDYLRKIYYDSGGNPALYERAIFGLDELDKLKGNLDIKVAAQDSLLKVLEGGVFDIELIKYGDRVSIDTTGMTMYGLGAFSEIFEEKKKEINSFGFNAGKTKEEVEKIKYDVTTKDLIKAGFKGEFIPRFPHRFVYKEMDAESMKIVLTQSNRSVLLRRVKRFLEQFHTELIYDDSFLDAFTDRALKEPSNGRSLDMICADTLIKAENKIMQADYIDGGKKKVLKISADIVSNPRKFELI